MYNIIIIIIITIKVSYRFNVSDDSLSLSVLSLEVLADRVRLAILCLFKEPEGDDVIIPAGAVPLLSLSPAPPPRSRLLVESRDMKDELCLNFSRSLK